MSKRVIAITTTGKGAVDPGKQGVLFVAVFDQSQCGDHVCSTLVLHSLSAHNLKELP